MSGGTSWRRRRGAVGWVLAVLVAGVVPLPSAATAAPAAPARGGCTGTVALTFDDGPNGAVTRRLLRLLGQAGVPATFFVVGQRVAAEPDVVRATERAGYLIANHSWAHVDMTTQSAAAVRSSLLRTQAALRRAGVHPTGLMRPPYGALDDEARAAIRSTGLVPVLWTVDPQNWAGGTSEQIAARIVGALHPGSNLVLQHDGVGNSPASVAAVPMIVSRAWARGYCFVALDEQGRPGFPTPTADLALRRDRLAEGGRTRAVVRLSKPAGRDVTVRLRVTAGSARPGDDVAPLDRTVRVPAGRLSASVPLRARRDGLDEPTERFAVQLVQPAGVRLGRSTGRLTVVDRDPPPRVDADDLTVAEPTDVPAVVRVPFVLDHVNGRPVGFRVELVPGTAGPEDAELRHARVRLAPGERRGEVLLRVLVDDPEQAGEPDETLRLRVVDPHHVRAGHGAVVTITPPV